MTKKTFFVILIISFVSFINTFNAQHSFARDWNELVLTAIRNDYARPTVHARNLFHTSIAMYDAWAIFDDTAQTVFLGKEFGGFTCNYNEIQKPIDKSSATREIMSYAMYRLLHHRFQNSPGAIETFQKVDNHFSSLGYDSNFTSIDYSNNSYAALGNYLASKIIEFGLQDGSNEANDYQNQNYIASNEPIALQMYRPNIYINPNLWQPLAFDVYADQSGNITYFDTPDFLSPEWGEVIPFCLKENDLVIKNNGFDSYVYNDPGPPVYIQDNLGINDPYKWHFALVIAWSAHLDPADNVLIDISPGSIGNVDITGFPESFNEYKNFYKFIDGGDIGKGHLKNPITGNPYEENIVKRADYARVLAEFWADGPDSETPPGHWFTIFNYVSDHPELEKKFNGKGNVLSNLEWDVKGYLTLGGAMHDSAINTWGIKGYYDYVRPISAIRYMAAKGQSSDASLPSYNPHGLPLIDNLIEVIEIGDPLAGPNNRNVGRIKVKSWKGPDYINNPNSDVAGVDWILGIRWWPYQRPTFVTPPFAGYVSGHSTFSRAAAEVLTLITNNAFFPGGIGTFDVEQNEFLVFEDGPSESFKLQWATYRDASDQTSLSRIWGGIHPPIDDIRGRIIGDKIGKDAFALAKSYFFNEKNLSSNVAFPNPLKKVLNLNLNISGKITYIFNTINGRMIFKENLQVVKGVNQIIVPELAKGIYILNIIDQNNNILLQQKLIK